MMDLIETTPKMDLAIQDIAHLVEELRAYHAIYSPLLQRREQREAAHTSLQGLLAPLPRINGWAFSSPVSDRRRRRRPTA